MPPEAQGGRVTYDTSLDAFSFGHLSLFTIIQEPIRLLPSTYCNDSTGEVHTRREEERRLQSVKAAEELLSKNHSLLVLIKQCLRNNPEQRPDTGEMLTRLQDIIIPDSDRSFSDAPTDGASITNEEYSNEILKSSEDGDLKKFRDIVETQKVDVHSCHDPTDNHSTPLHKASLCGHLDIVEYLVEEQQCDLECMDQSGKTPLHCAAKGGRLNVAEYLITRKAARMCRDLCGRTPLHFACKHSKLELVKYLMCLPHVINDCPESQNGSTPLHLAAEFGTEDIVRFMIDEQKLDKNCKNRKGNTLIHQAAYGGKLGILKYLINEKDSNPEAEGWRKRTPLHDACKMGRLEVAEYLLKEHKVNPACRDEKNATPLHMAARSGHLAVVQLLVEYYMCNPCVVTCNGETPSDYAQREGHKDIHEYLSTKIDVIATVELEITPGKHLYHHWEGYGLELYIPEDALQPDSHSSSLPVMKIQACLGGCHTLLSNRDLVSGVYQIKFPCTFVKPVQLRIQHYVRTENTHTLSFVTANSTCGVLPYQFKTLKGGKFYGNEGTIEITEFCRIGVNAAKEEPTVYMLKLYHLPKLTAKLSWTTHIAITVNADLHITHLNKQYISKNAEPGPYMVVEFADQNGEISFDIPREGITKGNGWSVTPISVSKLQQSLVDKCTKNMGEIPSYQLQVTWSGTKPPPDILCHGIHVKGIQQKDEYLTLMRDIEYKKTLQSADGPGHTTSKPTKKGSNSADKTAFRN
jgi:ankyrin repeat protein